MSAEPATSILTRPTLHPFRRSLSPTSPALTSCLLFLIVALTPSPPLTVASGHNLGKECTEHGAFACHSTEAGSFTRCIDHQLYLFHCPIGLHFNTLSQTCDWPENADCGDHHESSEEGDSGGVSSTNDVSGGDSSSSSSDHEHVITHNEIQRGDVGHREHKGQESWQRKHVKKWDQIASTASRGAKKFKDSGYSSPIRLSNSEKPWWRPDNVDPRAWTDLSNLVEVPFDGSVSASASRSKKQESGRKRKSGNVKLKAGKETEGGKRKSEGGTRGHDHSHQPVVKVRDTAPRQQPRSENVQLQSGPCSPDSCRPPHCWCPGTVIPGGLSPKDTPQMVMLTFDDEVSAAYYGYFQRLFRPGRYNPNGCPVRGCLFVSGSGTDYDLVYPLYAMGVEVASHTLSHKFPHTWWASASYGDYVDEVEGMKRALSSNAGVPADAIKGFRVPFLQLGGDNMYKTLYDNQFLYDTSMFTGSVWEGSDPVWPFTLDFPIPEDYCQHGPCPQNQYPGLWEIPVQRWYGVDGHSCAMPDGCTASADAEEDLEFFRSNFKRYYQSNRAPFGIFVHARWFHTEHHLDALDRFIDELMQLDDVYIVTPSQVIEWMRNPTSLDSIKRFRPWACEGSEPGENRRR